MQLRALRAIALGEGCSQAALAERLTVDAPAVSRLVDRLEADGLLQRGPGGDRRSVCLEVTAAAEPELAMMHEVLQWLDAEVHRHLSAQESAQLQRLLEKLDDGLREDR